MSLEPRKLPDKSEEVLYLSTDQWDRIKDQIGLKSKMEGAIKAQVAERKALKELSKKMTENWANTHAGLYKERLQSRKIKAYNEEVQRVHDDILEEKYQETRRKYVLEQAKKRLYFETDRVKRLQAAKLLAEVLKERESQRKFRENARRALANFEAEFSKGTLRDVDQYNAEIKLRAQREELKKKKIAKTLKEQDAEIKEKMVKEKEDDYRLGKVLKEEDDRHALEVKDEEARIKNQKIKYKKSLDVELTRKRQIEEALNKMQEADVKRAELFDEAKRKMIQLHKEKLKEFERRKEEQKEILMKSMTDEVGIRRLKEERMYQNAVQEKQRIEEQCQREKADKHIKDLKDLHDFHGEKLQIAAAKRDALKRASYYEGRQYKEEAEKFLQEQVDEVKHHYEAGKKAQFVQLQQIESKKDVESQQLQSQLQNTMSHVKGLRDEEEMFQRYAKHLIDECEKQGLDTFALRKAAEPGIECGRGPFYQGRGGIRPKYLAANVVGADMQMKKIPERKEVNVRARLGFGF